MFRIIAFIIIIYIILMGWQLIYLSSSEKCEATLLDTYKHVFSFKTLYEETSLNELGVILYLLIQIIFFLPAAAVYFIYWLCHKKEK